MLKNKYATFFHDSREPSGKRSNSSGPPVAVWWVCKDNVEPFWALRQQLQSPSGIHPQNIMTGSPYKFTDLPGTPCGYLHKHHLGEASSRGLSPYPSGPGKKIQERPLFPLSEDVEECLEDKT